ncbi:similar to UBX domain-containing protein [Botrytis cinerea T4]|uniref:Similar to UBX domain-containing protein n=1 Tax=Botryotinia fuckeliana (strain T4) TaxID=999810 RepID=G2YY42_BOTF4|nr:similar to UBX domain-containing protein [Botrytis cinerea T4]
MAAAMFYTGDINSGISKALAESKLVACFVTILLRLSAGSEEANYLAAIFPIPKAPTLVAIWNGELKEYLSAGISKDDFLVRFKKALESTSSQRNVENDRTVSPNGTQALQNPEQRTTEGQSSGVLPTHNSNNGTMSASQSDYNNATGQPSTSSHPRDPKGKLPEDSKAAENHSKQSSQAAETVSYAAIQKKRQQEAREERARILALVESDKARRRNDAGRKPSRSDHDTEQSVASGDKNTSIPTTASKAQDCALQIRLFDGSSIRSRFPSTSTISGDVRKWVDSQQKDDAPYIFKQVCTPLPNKTLSMTDESQHLASLGLSPSATGNRLIIVPVQTYTSAYEVTESSSILSRGIAAGYGLGAWGVNRVLSTLGGIVGNSATTSDTEQMVGSSTSVGGGRASNLRTLRDQNDNDNHHELYNGNTLNFEPRRDDNDGQN